MLKGLFRVDENGLINCVSYAAQSPGLRHHSIMGNISCLGALSMKSSTMRFWNVAYLHKPDLKMLEDGNATEIGARYIFSSIYWSILRSLFFFRGVSLSGGQKVELGLPML